ncbi:MAG: type III pantothenate kinase [Planctomycetes bacterium]|nr:type III pantothenate kinase [Planctomycetota bacterium]
MSQSLIAIAVGNTRTRFGLFEGGKEISGATSLANNDGAALRAAIVALTEDRHDVPIVMSSVNHPVADSLCRDLDDSTGDTVLRVNRDLAVPMKHSLEDATTLGQDRILCAYGAFRRAKQACVVIDAGTAITVDFVDGHGVFHGGAIAPGVNMMLRAMHEKTTALPSLEFTPPDMARGPFGKDTTHAMLLGVRGAAVGLAHLLIDEYAAFYEAYPQVVATGGDAAALFENDELVEHVIPDLQLIGIMEAFMAAQEEEAGAEHGEPG